MARTFITVTRGHDSTDWDVLHGPGVPSNTQEDDMKEFMRLREHPRVAEVQLWSSDGGCRRRHTLAKFGTYQPPAVEPAPAPAVEQPKNQPKKEKTK